MTNEAFLKFHGQQWAELRRGQIFTDLLATLRSSDPARATPGVAAGDATANAQNLLGRIAGFNLAVNLLESGIVADVPADVLGEPEYPADQPPTDE